MSESQDEKLGPGAMVGGYRIERLLGRGGAGTVYAAEEPTIKKRVAIKVLRRALADDELMIARFEREARAVNEIRHPGIIDVFGIGKLKDGRPYLVMSLLDGRPLREELALRGRLGLAEAWRIAREVAEALAAAHDAGIVHRDLKPDNVFLERVGPRLGAPPGEAGLRPQTPGPTSDKPPRVRVLDFGIAKVEEPEPGAEPMKLTATGVPLGTPAYMAPEQWWATGITTRTDQYAFGAMLFEMIAGRPPFDSRQFAELVHLHVHEKPPSLAEVGAPVPEAVEALVARALAKSPDDRFASMAELIEAGDRAFAGAGDESAPVAPPSQPVSAAPKRAAPEAIVTPPLPASGDAIATAQTELVPSHVPASARLGDLALRRYYVVHAAILAIGTAGICAVGYAGEDKHNPWQWFRIGGWGQWGDLIMLLVGVIALPWLAKRRARTGVPSNAGFWIALAPALQGAFTTYTGWHAIMRGLGHASAIDHLRIFNEGTYEANAGRFFGFWVSAMLFLSVAALPGVSGLVSATTTLTGAIGVRRREALAAAAGLVVIAAVAVLVGSPSGALVAAATAATIAISAVLPTVHGETAARDELERAAAGLFAIGLTVAVGVTRMEARGAVLWGESATRAGRVAEILATARESNATIPIAVASLAVLAAIEALRLRRLRPLRVITRPRTGTALLAIALLLGIAGDFVQHGRFSQKRDELRAELSAQFALFARLDPPPGDALDPELFPPHRSTALQITRDVVAVDGRGVARLAALDAPEGAAHVAADLNHALAQAALAEKDAAGVDLSISIDREVKGRVIAMLLRIARAAGARRIEILLTRGESPQSGRGAPAEVDVVLPNDFVALPAVLADEGVTLDEDEVFGKLAPRLMERALGGRTVSIAAKR
jgi:serine/threonine protein kinase